MYSPYYIFIGFSLVVISLVIYTKIIPHMRAHNKYHATGLLFVCAGEGSVGVARIFEGFGVGGHAITYIAGDTLTAFGMLLILWQGRKIITAHKRRQSKL